MNSSLIRVIATPVIALLFWLLPLRVTSKQLLSMAFFFWMLGGLALTILGAKRLTEVMGDSDMVTLSVVLVLAIAIGIAKGRFVLAKSSKRNIDRINAIDEPVKLIHVYALRSWIIIEVMLLISASLTWFSAPVFWRGIVNVAVGLALIMSSLAYVQAKPAAEVADSNS